jgi:hypothetical protein
MERSREVLMKKVRFPSTTERCRTYRTTWNLPELHRTNENGSQNGQEPPGTVLSFSERFSRFWRTFRTVLELPQNSQNVLEPPENERGSPERSRTRQVPYYVYGEFIKYLEI